MFLDKLEQTINTYSFTENGALGYKTNSRNLEDVFFSISKFRSVAFNPSLRDELIQRFEDLLEVESKETVLKLLFHIRDIREGMGEREIFRAVLHDFATKGLIDKRLIPLIPEFGRFDDLYYLVGTPLANAMFEYIKEVLDKDLKAYDNGDSITLLAKWLPSINTSSDAKRRLANLTAKHLGMSASQYRKTLSKLRAYSNVVEVAMCKNNWKEINYELVPSKANLKYKNAFLRHDVDRREAFLKKALEFAKTTLNNSLYKAKVTFPYEVIHEIISGKIKDTEAEVMWLNLNRANELSNTLVVADTSGSMISRVNAGSSDVTCWEVAESLAILAAEQNKGEFKNKVITFSTNPQFITFEDGSTIIEKHKEYKKHSIVDSTDIAAVFRLILKTAVDNKVPQDELPTRVLILSDMEFNSAVYRHWGTSMEEYSKTLFEVIAQEYADCGYKLPKLVFWNICSRTGTIPMRQNEYGVIFVGGFSQNLFNLVMSDQTNPRDAILEILNSPRYSEIY